MCTSHSWTVFLPMSMLLFHVYLNSTQEEETNLQCYGREKWIIEMSVRKLKRNVFQVLVSATFYHFLHCERSEFHCPNVLCAWYLNSAIAQFNFCSLLSFSLEQITIVIISSPQVSCVCCVWCYMLAVVCVKLCLCVTMWVLFSLYPMF